MGVVLILCGSIAAVVGVARGYASARSAVGPLVHEGEPTRTLIEAAQPLHARSRVRLFARRVAEAAGWLVVALYGLYLATVGVEVAG